MRAIETHSFAQDNRRGMAALRARAVPGFLILPLVFVVCAMAVAGQRPHGTRSMVAVSYLNAKPGIEYVGSKVCAECHADIYHEYVRTAMGRSMTTPEDDPAFPPTPSTVQFEKLHRSFEAFRQNGELFQAEFEPDAGGGAFRDAERIAYVIGAGQNGFGYLVQRGGYLFEAPLTFYTRSREWNLSPGYEFADYGFLRPVPEACIVCHSGRARPVQNRPGLYQNPAFEQLAIGCENCHGPGELHVEERRAGKPLKGPIDLSIVNPAQLPGWLADNTCMMCHQAGDTRVLQPGKTYADFRPGEPLNQTVAIFAAPFTPESPPQSPLLQHYELMKLSKCFRASRGRMSCITCHDPHVEPSAAEAPAYYRKKCLSCHTLRSCNLPMAKRLAASDNCIECHMPQQKLERIAHSALTNHRIIATPDEPFPQAAFHETTAALPDLVYVDAAPGKRTAPPAMVLFQAYGELMAKYPAYKTRYETLLDQLSVSEPNDPVVLSALARRDLASGTSQALAAARDKLGEAIKAGSTLDSDYEIEAELLARSGETEDAIEVLKKGIALNPYAPRLFKRLALVYIGAHDYADALSAMKQELAMDPEDDLVRSLIARAEGTK